MSNIEVRLKNVEEKLENIEKLVNTLVNAITVIIAEPEELTEEERREILEALEDYLKNRTNQFISLDHIKEHLEEEK